MSSSTLTSEKPTNQYQTEKLGLGVLIPERTVSDFEKKYGPEEIQDFERCAVEEAKGNANVKVEEVEVEELRNAIEKEIQQLTLEQAEIAAACRRPFEFDDDRENEMDLRNGENENCEEEKIGEDVGNVEDENENEGDGWKKVEDSEEENENGNEEEEAPGGEFVMMVMKNGGYDSINNGRKRLSPMRPNAEDCTYYMKTGSCRYGFSCKFNHPPRRNNQGVMERSIKREENPDSPKQTKCKYYLTSGGCKYGKDCKYNHAGKSLSSPILELNFLGLPMRLGAKECLYYMRNGSCKYGSNCRFHHPDPTTVAGDDHPSGYGNGGSLPPQGVSPSSVSSWSSPRALNETSPFFPTMFPPTQGVTSPILHWNGYQAAAYPTSERSLPTPPAFAMNNLPTETNFDVQHQQEMGIEEYPERPGEPECSFFLKNGDCKYKFNCKFHHPKNGISKGNANSCALSDTGLPIRPDQPVCRYFHDFGICKFGPTCKYHHPQHLAAFYQPPVGIAETVDGAGMLRRRNGSKSSVQ